MMHTLDLLTRLLAPICAIITIGAWALTHVQHGGSSFWLILPVVLCVAGGLWRRYWERHHRATIEALQLQATKQPAAITEEYHQ
jgi:hypothetical protein